MSDAFAWHADRPLKLALWRDARYRREAALIAPLIDAEFYLEANADVAAAGLDAGFHYAKHGWREGRDPSPSFSTKGYLTAHPKVALSGINPLLHFMRQNHGSSGSTLTTIAAVDPKEIALVADHIDPVFYARNTPDFERSGLTAEAHFCQVGWRQGADPSPDFSTSYYLTTNPDVRDKGVNPFWHYLIAGKREGRLPLHPGGWKHAALAGQTSFKAYRDGWMLDEKPKLPLGADALLKRIQDARRSEHLMLSFGHDDYRSTPGGVQLCISLEEKRAQGAGFDYLNLHPWQPLPDLADVGDDPFLTLVLNGETLGVARISSVTQALSRDNACALPPKVVIHHLAGHSVEAIVDLAKQLQVTRATFWLHDFFSLCASYALQRNNVSPCAAPARQSNACAICLYGGIRHNHLTRFEAFFDQLQIDVVSPSKAALTFWKSRATMTGLSETVHPHVRLEELSPAQLLPGQSAGPVRIAFVGTPTPHKGWPVFRELQRRLSADDGYEFWYFGVTPPGAMPVKHVDVHVQAGAPDRMMALIAEHQIDLVVHWASWPETFSFSTFEAFGGGAFVLTNQGSGNVAAAVQRLGRGAVLPDEDSLYALAKDGGLAALAEDARTSRVTKPLAAHYSGMSVDLMEVEVAP
ncbi:MAG: hypothetical protein AAFY31_11710 [Pseudomonadota bacterium]